MTQLLFNRDEFPLQPGVPDQERSNRYVIDENGVLLSSHRFFFDAHEIAAELSRQHKGTTFLVYGVIDAEDAILGYFHNGELLTIFDLGEDFPDA